MAKKNAGKKVEQGNVAVLEQLPNVEVIAVGDAPTTPITEGGVAEVQEVEVPTDVAEQVAKAKLGLDELEAMEAAMEAAIENVEEPKQSIMDKARATAKIPPVTPAKPAAAKAAPKASAKGNKASTKVEEEYPEVGTFETEKAMKKHIKGLSDEQLAEWLKLEGLTYKPNENQGINRMRMAMAIKAKHFPPANTPKPKSKSKYADISTEELVQIAMDNDVEIKDDKGNPAILRMYAIMALREAGLLE